MTSCPGCMLGLLSSTSSVLSRMSTTSAAVGSAAHQSSHRLLISPANHLMMYQGVCSRLNQKNADSSCLARSQSARPIWIAVMLTAALSDGCARTLPHLIRCREDI
eukprot:2881-Heterococcus_DN1.PRE.1